jgi:hypothetical protein
MIIYIVDDILIVVYWHAFYIHSIKLKLLYIIFTILVN